MRKDLDSRCHEVGGWSELEEVRERVNRLEQSQRRTRLATATAVVMFLGCAWLTGQGTDRARSLLAERVGIVDANGKERISLDLEENIPQLALRDANGVVRIALEVEANGGPVIWLNDENDIGRAVIGLGGGRYPFLEFYDPKTGEPKISMAIVRRGDAFLHIYDKERNDYWKAP